MKRLFAAVAVGALSAYVLLPLPGQSSPLSERIEKKRDAISHAKRREGTLTADIERYRIRVAALAGEITSLGRRQRRVQATLDEKRSELLALRARLARARDRLERLRVEVRRAERALAQRLVEIYKADEPDLLTVVLEADGFSDLLERTAFLERVADQDNRIVVRLRDLKAEAKRQADVLAALERRAQRATNAILAQRNQLASARAQLSASRARLASARARRRAVLTRVRQSRARAEEDLASLEREQARVRARLRAAQRSAFAPAAGPIRRGSGSLIWPVTGTLTSPFGMRWGRLHAGIDIAAPEGTPIRAADSGRVVLAAAQGGYGLYTCIQHTASMSTCYAHQSRLGTASGAAVAQGEIMGYVGNTGNSFGAHLHFEVRINGQPVDPLGYL